MNKTKQLITTTNLVMMLLETDPQTRNSDYFLYLKALEHVAIQKGIDLQCLTVPNFLMSINVLGFPCFETVRRTRQKIQEKHPELQACKSVKEARAENEVAVRSYARSEV